MNLHQILTLAGQILKQESNYIKVMKSNNVCVTYSQLERGGARLESNGSKQNNPNNYFKNFNIDFTHLQRYTKNKLSRFSMTPDSS